MIEFGVEKLFLWGITPTRDVTKDDLGSNTEYTPTLYPHPLSLVTPL